MRLIMTQLEIARKGKISEEMEICAKYESVSPEYIRKGVEDGTIVVTRNKKHTSILPLAIGKGLKTKVNSNIGTSKSSSSTGSISTLSPTSTPWAKGPRLSMHTTSNETAHLGHLGTLTIPIPFPWQ